MPLEQGSEVPQEIVQQMHLNLSPLPLLKDFKIMRRPMTASQRQDDLYSGYSLPQNGNSMGMADLIAKEDVRGARAVLDLKTFGAIGENHSYFPTLVKTWDSARLGNGLPQLQPTPQDLDVEHQRYMSIDQPYDRSPSPNYIYSLGHVSRKPNMTNYNNDPSFDEFKLQNYGSAGGRVFHLQGKANFGTRKGYAAWGSTLEGVDRSSPMMFCELFKKTVSRLSHHP